MMPVGLEARYLLLDICGIRVIGGDAFDESEIHSRRPILASDRFAQPLRGFGLLGILAILVILAGNLVILPLSAVLVLVWAWLSRTAMARDRLRAARELDRQRSPSASSFGSRLNS